MALGLTQPVTEMSTSNISCGVKAAVRRADNHTTFMCRLPWYLRTSTSFNPQGLSRLVMGSLYFFYSRIYTYTLKWRFHLTKAFPLCIYGLKKDCNTDWSITSHFR